MRKLGSGDYVLVWHDSSRRRVEGLAVLQRFERDRIGREGESIWRVRWVRLGERLNIIPVSELYDPLRIVHPADYVSREIEAALPRDYVGRDIETMLQELMDSPPEPRPSSPPDELHRATERDGGQGELLPPPRPPTAQERGK